MSTAPGRVKSGNKAVGAHKKGAYAKHSQKTGFDDRVISCHDIMTIGFQFCFHCISNMFAFVRPYYYAIVIFRVFSHKLYYNYIELLPI